MNAITVTVNDILLSNEISKTKPCCRKVANQNYKVTDHTVGGRQIVRALYVGTASDPEVTGLTLLVAECYQIRLSDGCH